MLCQLVIYQGHNRNSIMINKSMPSVNYDTYKTIFEAMAGEWILYSEPAFTGRTKYINPCYGKLRIPFTVKSVKPNSVRI